MSRLRSRPPEPSHSSHDRWLVSYADFVTLLLAFFVSLYAFTRLDSDKLAQAQISIQQALHTAFPAGKPNVIPELRQTRLFPGILPEHQCTGETDQQKLARLETQLAATHQELTTLLPLKTERRDYEIFFTPDGMVIRFRDGFLFDTGKADIRPEVLPLLHQVAAILQKIPNNIIVEGHTDARPIHTPQFPSNWELSTARATALVRDFIEQAAIAPNRLSAAGYGEYRPVADNHTDTGQAANRRVDIIVRPLLPAPLPPPATSPDAKPNATVSSSPSESSSGGLTNDR